MEKIAGCWEHLSMVWHALKEARAQKSNLAIIWLDIANAYGSIPHKLIVRSPNDEDSQFSKLHFPCNREERLVLNSYFREYNLYLKKKKKKKNFKSV